MSNYLKFSIIIPTYNRAQKLRRGLESLLSQSYSGDFEVIVCDDGSTDNTSDIVDEYKNRLNIEYIKSTNWGGPARPRNLGMRKASGDFVCFLDSDDWFYPNKLEVLAHVIDDYDVIYHDLKIYNQNNSGKVKQGRALSYPVYRDLLSNPNPIATSGVTVRRSIMKEVKFLEDKTLTGVEDYDAWLKLSRLTEKFKYINQILGGYEEEHGSNISEHLDAQIARKVDLFNRHIGNLSDNDASIARHNFNLHISTFQYRAQDYSGARRSLREVLKKGSFYQKVKALCYMVYIMVNKTIKK